MRSRALLLLALTAAPLWAQEKLNTLPCKVGATCAGSTAVTTTSTLVSGRVALSSGAASLTDDAGLTRTGTGTGFKLGIGTDVFLSRAAGLLLVEDGSGNARDVQARTGTFGTSVVTPAVSSIGDTVLQISTNGAGRWYFGESTFGYALLPSSDNALDIGSASAPLRLRTGHFGTSVVTPAVSGGAAVGTDQPGSDIAIQPKIGTGSSTPADITFSLGIQGASGATPQSTFTALQLNRYFASFGVPPIPASDNAYDFGSNARRWAIGYFGTSLISPLLTSGPGKSGTNVAGADNVIQAEPGTGSATGSSIILQTPTAGASGTTAQTQTTRLTLAESAVIAAVPVRLMGYTVATLPAGTVGDTAYVTDATAPTYLGALTGGGAVVVPVFFDGTSWKSH